MVQRVIVFIFVVVFGIATAFGKTYKYTYPIACGNLWPAVKDTLANQDEYAKVAVDEAKTTAEYQPKHSVHVDITGTVLQRINHVTLVPKGTGCEMEVVSNWSGWGHEDQGDFKKRVDETLVKAKAPGEPAKPAAVAAKPAGPGE
jgi:hypothetical protein